MKTTDYGFLRLILCSNVLWKDVLRGAVAFLVYVLLYAVVVGCLSLFVDLLGLPGDLVREHVLSEPGRRAGLQDKRHWAESLMEAGMIVLLFLWIGATSCMTTIKVIVTRTKLAVIKDPRPGRNRTAEIYQLSDVEGRRGWHLAKWMGVCLRVKDRDQPVCFVLKRDRAAAVIEHVNQARCNGQ